jgi:hypothetical protein
MTEEEGPLPVIPLSDGAHLTILGPPRKKLVAFAPEWEQAFKRLSASLPGQRQRPIPNVHNLRMLAETPDVPDRTKPNGTSISFMIQYRKRTALFAADAHPDDLAEAVARLGATRSRVEFDLIKAPHHGSLHNNTTALMRLLAARRWLISTDGSRHQHPDPEAIARVLLGSPGPKTLFFNYRSEYNDVWEDRQLRETYRYETEYASKEGALTINLLDDQPSRAAGASPKN